MLADRGDIAHEDAIENTDGLINTPDGDNFGAIVQKISQKIGKEGGFGLRIPRDIETFEQKRARFNKILEALKENLENEPDVVWPPYGAWKMLETLIDQGKFDNIEGKTVLDIGCGNGVIGIALAIFGAKSVVLVDNNTDAVELASRNIANLEVHNASVKYSDVFSNVEGQFDIIIGNLPFNPTVEGVYIANKAERSNQNGSQGVGVMRVVVKDLEKHLVEHSGRMYITCSSRQGRITLSGLLNKFLRPGNWHELNSNQQQLTYEPSAQQALIGDYIAPFLEFYNSETLRDDSIRYFYEDHEGNWGVNIHQEIGNDDGGYINTTYVIPNYHKYPFLKNGYLAYKVTTELTTEGRTTTVRGISGNKAKDEKPLDIRKIDTLLDITAGAERRFSGDIHHLYYVVEGWIDHEQ